jgi:dinuclear metal center YbgI/SA1388 family protein
MNSPHSDTPSALTIGEVLEFLRRLAPLELAEEWDNVGLLWGDTQRAVARVMTCLTLSPDVAEEGVRCRAELIVVHHPILFRPVQRLTHETPAGGMLLSLARHGVAVYSAHTAYDNAAEGINRQLADRLGLEAVVPLRLGPSQNSQTSPDGHPGIGRIGRLPEARSLMEFIADAKRQLGVAEIQFVGPPELHVERVAIACGSGADFVDDAIRQGCQVLLTGEARFHACLEARERGLALILLGHFASEQPAMHILADQIRRRFPELEVWASLVECDPLGSAE